ncbi:MAG: undecaprenyl-phosphate glucose phosphotransferase [Xanthomonadales bacterium]|nr:undecaprenyl-phosphate glucose phosphotransferase [Xanthomonadales bacterium]
MANLGSMLVILLAFLAAYWARFGLVPLTPQYLVVLLMGLLLVSVVFPATGAFRNEFKWAALRRVRRLLAGWAVVIMVMVVLSAMLKTTAVYSRIWFGYWVLFGAIGLVLFQALTFFWRRRIRRKGAMRRKLVLVGAGAAAARVEARLAADPQGDFEVVGRFGEAWSEHATGPLEQLADFVQDNEVHDVWIAAPLDNAQLMERSLEYLKNAVVDIHVIPDLEQYRLLNQGISEWEGLPFINLSGIPMTGDELALKNVMDRAGAAVLLLLLSPLLLLIALLVRLSGPGPVLFRQQRHGFGGEIIEVLKFRTMKPHEEPAGQVTQARATDARVTTVGRWLRRSSLDELPQLLNVLKGEMSLVGPRPHALEHNQFYMDRIPRYMLRHKVRPGITGWAQVNGFRGITDTEEKMLLRIEHDLWYIQNWSLWLDVRILLRTPLAMVGRNAV